MESIKKMAMKYYPVLWSLARLHALLKAGRLTRAEYGEVTAPAEAGTALPAAPAAQ